MIICSLNTGNLEISKLLLLVKLADQDIFRFLSSVFLREFHQRLAQLHQSGPLNNTDGALLSIHAQA